LISANGYAWLFEQLKSLLNFAVDCAITLEANPWILVHDPFAGYLEAGINRLSIGVQSLNTDHLHKLGRIHSANNAMDAISQARQAGFKRVHVDLIHGLP
ncbi:radical SAM protein, partial [Acinetobacter baumannii]|uniref:radical SAM protein n=1 Tax=Acinetobacter baumannii TaxID=470 RepID=UPI000B0BB92D